MSSCHLRFRIWSWQELRELRSRRPWNMMVGKGKEIFFAWLVSKFECLSESLRELPKNDPSFIPDLQKSDSLGTRHGTLNMFPQVSGPGLWTTIPNMVFPGGSDGKVSTCNAGDPASIPESGGFPGEGKLLQYSCLGNSTDRGAWQATVHRAAKSRTRLSN